MSCIVIALSFQQSVLIIHANLGKPETIHNIDTTRYYVTTFGCHAACQISSRKALHFEWGTTHVRSSESVVEGNLIKVQNAIISCTTRCDEIIGIAPYVNRTIHVA